MRLDPKKRLFLALLVAAVVPSLHSQDVEQVNVTDASIQGNVTWTADREYILNGFVFVEDGETLTIEPGTVVRGMPGEAESASALIVARGGTIMAEGTADAPIIFTALNDDVSDPTDFNGGDVGEWGGLILLGNAPLNSPEGSGTPITDNIEGIPESEPRGEFGGADPMDNSGVLRFVSVRHGGTNIGANNEINGVTFGGVGAGTTVEFVEVFANKDDGFEFFGGTVNTKFLIAAFVGDDSFDYDQGFTGKGQFWFSLGTGDRGGEHDGDVDDLNNLPLSNPTILNATYIGPGSDFDGSGDAVKLRENAAGKYFNSVFAHFPDRAIDVDSTLEDGAADPTANNIASGELDFRENIFFDFGRDAENNSSSAAQDLFSADRNNVFVDPEFEAYAPFGLTDPRPMVGSPALMAGSDEPTDGFFSDVSFKGAFGRENWVGGWTIAAESGLVSDMGASIPDYPLAQTVTQIQVTDASIDGDTVWTAGNEYILDGFVFVEDGEMLTIEAGTVIRGMPGEAESASALIVARGGKIMAEGTPEAPIIFTALNDDLSDPTDFSAGDVGEWGGLIVLGHAPLNSPEGSGTPITDNIEGIPESEPRGEFGGADPMDNSGVLRFVSVRHGGTNIGANNEINGVTFGGVGAGTTVEYIEVFANKDDGFEFFGGTVNTKFLIAAYVGDDSFDYDQGFTGKGQFWLSIGTGDRGGEHDGDVDDLNNLPLSNPTIFNVSYIGPGSDFEGSGDAVKLRENAAGKYFNSIFAHFPDRAIDVDSTLEDGTADPTANNIASGELDFRDNIFFDFGRDAANNSSSAAQALFSADRNNVFVDPMFGAYTPFGLIDPVPMAGSPAMEAGSDEPADGFFSDVSFKGAFGAANWAGGWSIAAQSGLLSNEAPMIPDYPLAEGVTQVQITDASIEGDTVWTAGNEYILDGFVFVEDGETLTIEAGAVIRGMPGEAESASALIVARGGKIMAEGTAQAPIIFTALNDDLSDPTDFSAGDVGEWGGLIVLGHAPLNSPEGSGTPITDNIEGIPESEPRGEFGGADPMDNSGVLRFVSVRHGGTNIGANNEINGVTFGGVGAGTTVEYIEVFANKDDGFEFFGGTVNTKWLVAAFVGDDSFDYDQGYTGKGQFWFSLGTGDRGGEHDGDVDDLNNLPLSNPTILNATYIGPGSDFDGSGDAVKLRENAAGKYYNSIFAHFPDRAIDVDSTLEDGSADPTANNIASGELDFRENIFFDFGRDAENNSSSAAQALFSADRNNVFVDPMFTAYTPFGLTDPRPMAGSPALEAGFPAPADGFFSDVDFKGAFNETNWIAGWTILAQSGLASSEGAGFNDFPVARVPATITIAPDGPGFVRMTVMTAVGASYQMQQSSDLVEWTDVGAAVVGDGMPHNERVATSDDIAFFRYVVE